MGGMVGAEIWGELGSSMFHQSDRQPPFGEFNFNINPNSFVCTASCRQKNSSRVHGMLIIRDPQ